MRIKIFLLPIACACKKTSLEVSGNNGQAMSTMIYPDREAKGVSAFATGNAFISDLKIWDMDK